MRKAIKVSKQELVLKLLSNNDRNHKQQLAKRVIKMMNSANFGNWLYLCIISFLYEGNTHVFTERISNV